MSLENSQYTFASLLGAGKDAFRKEVDRITKEADEDEAVPIKRGRYSQSQDSGIGSQTIIRRQNRVVSGTIVEVTLEDFLCHKHLTVKLNSQITFIVGRNGSGKSAVLTGIVVALGGNASTTGRGASLKDFIRHGCNSAKVTCVVNNAGPLNHKREEYGDKIIVVRTLLLQGGSSIKLKSERGKLISSKMEDLRNMTLALGIQVDNPISVLDQNTARHFLNQSRPSTKFELFMRATNLDTLKDIYMQIYMAVTKINQEISKKQRQLSDNNTEVEEAKRRHEMVESLGKDRAKLDCLKMESLWAQSRDSSIDLDHAKRKLKKVQDEKERLNNMLSSEENTEPILQQIESSKTDARALEDQQKEIDNEVRENKAKIAGVAQKIKKWKEEKSQIECKLRTVQKNIEEYKTEIRSQEEKMVPGHVDRRQQQRQQIEELRRTLLKIKSDRESKQAEANALQNNLNGLSETVDDLRNTKGRYDKDLGNLRNKLQGLEANDSNLSLFGPCFPELAQEIEANARRFKKKPIGPLGSYVKVKDPKWTLAVESVLRARLSTFVVDNAEDEKLLLSIIKRLRQPGPRPSVTQTPFPTRPYDTSRSAARTDNYTNVLDVIEVSNVVASNILIDLCRIESTMLIPTDNECHRLLSEARSVPRNCFKAYTLKADQYFPAPNYRTYAATQKSARILQASRNDVIRDIQQRISNLESELPCIIQKISEASSNAESIKAQRKQAEQAVGSLSHKFLVAQRKLEELRDVEEPDINTISVLREELASEEKKLEECKALHSELPEKQTALKTSFESLKEKEIELRTKWREINTEKEKLSSHQKALREQLDEFQSAQVGKKKKVEQFSKQEEQLLKDCKELEEKCVELKGDAERYHSHVESVSEVFVSMKETKRSLKTIDQELRTLHKRLESIQKTLGQSAESIQQDFLEKFQAYNQTQAFIKQLRNNAAFLKHALDLRKKLYHTQKNLMCAVTSHQFTRVLRYRNCNGKVSVNFERKELDIDVGPVDEGERTGLGTNSLSGGERSYATMAFVIALWNVTELPFYYLDEFDVFMDCLNRQTVLTLLLRFAKQKLGYQFGFLTPLDTTNIVSEDDRVSIYKLNDPER